ncbi:MAG: hypothetical protein B7Z53_02035 [Rhodospirillales bacterium 12-71-4]|nr:MAG: hypothetical protein B7Z53_02035 [Rhodospirillales bacterium 12-71-4]
MILRMAAGGMMGAVAVAGAVTTLALGAGAVGTVLLARRLCEERKGWRDGAKAEPEMASAAAAEEPAGPGMPDLA